MPRDPRRDDAIRITTAASSRHDDISTRQRRYVLSMTLRTACFVGAVVAGSGFGVWWLCWVLIVGAVGLPYVAVVLANATDQRSDSVDLPDTAYRPELAAPAPEPRAGHR